MLNQIQSELNRIGANRVQVSLDDQFEPQAGTLVKVLLNGAYWHLLPERFLALLKQLPASAGSEAVRRMIETDAVLVWHGPAPRESRD